MPREAPHPRDLIRQEYPALGQNDTWLEPEAYCYPSGAQLRRARCKMPDGSLRVVRCGIPDTFFSIPAHVTIKGKYVRGWVSSNDEQEFTFHPITQETHERPDPQSTPA